nr:PREDICTED: fatty acid synthase-like [Bemisia tabaci]
MERMEKRNLSCELNDEVVIAGFSGRFPESRNVEEFKKHLFDGTDMVTEDGRRWPPGLYDLPSRTGKLPSLEFFDAPFFGVHPKQASVMDPQLRILLELTYESIIDAGVNPEEVRGSKTGVFIGASLNESYDLWAKNRKSQDGYRALGCTRTMLANRISFTFDFQGPSYTVDTACSSSMFALQQAVSAIRGGQCDAAIIGGVNLLLNPETSLLLKNLNVLSPSGKSNSFDAAANGYAQSEAAVVMYLQRASAAKRLYATVVHAKTNNDGYKDQGITFPSGSLQKALIESTFSEAGMDPNSIVYLEAHATGTKVGDPVEMNTVAAVFAENRDSPLLIGSVKSNMGHAEAASGLCSIAKVLIAMETGAIPGNLHFKQPNPNIPGLLDGRLQVVDKPLTWDGGLVAVNSFGFGGANAHVILRSKETSKPVPIRDTLPRIVAVSGRTEEAVLFQLAEIEKLPRNDEFIGLIHGLYKKTMHNHDYRGYTVLESYPPMREVKSCHGQKRPVWYVFPGMGSQWAGMTKAILTCADVLRVENFDLIAVLNSDDERTFENPLNSFVSIVAVQIGLVDILASVGVVADGMIGHSFGELGCAYVDGALTAEQTVLAAYWRGRSIADSHVPSGSMAVFGLPWECVAKYAPADIFPSCNNSSDSVTVSGPPASVTNFINVLKLRGVFVKEIKTCGVAFHCKYVANAAPYLQMSLEKVLFQSIQLQTLHTNLTQISIIPKPKPRTSRWISSSIPKSSWDTSLAQTASPAYFVNNLLMPVLFKDAVTHIPNDAIVIEIAPHCILQSILKQNLRPDNIIIDSLKKGVDNISAALLSSMGKLYNAGIEVNFANLFSPTAFPVSRGTPMLQSLIKWDHSSRWPVASFCKEVLKTIKLRKQPERFYCTVKFSVYILKASGNFELSEGGSVVLSGKISIPENIEDEQLTLDEPADDKTDTLLNANDFYKYARLRGYDYGGMFLGVTECDMNGVKGKVAWADDWITYLGSIFQFFAFGMNSSKLHVITRIQRVSINPMLHFRYLSSIPEKDKTIPVFNFADIGVIQSCGTEIRGLKVSLVPRKQKIGLVKKEKYLFVPYIIDKTDLMINEYNALTSILQTVIENSDCPTKMKVIELAVAQSSDAFLSTKVKKILEEKFRHAGVTVISNQGEVSERILKPLGTRMIETNTNVIVDQNCHLVVAKNCLDNQNVLSNMLAIVQEGNFILLEQHKHLDENAVNEIGLDVISIVKTCKTTYALLRSPVEIHMPIVITITRQFSWVNELKAALVEAEIEEKELILLVENEALSGIVGLLNCLKQEYSNVNIRCVFIQEEAAPKFSLTTHFCYTQLKKGLIHNVYKNHQWGCYRYISLDSDSGTATVKVEHAYMQALVLGDLSSLKWVQGPSSSCRLKPNVNSELCHVYYAPLNFRDIMLASGKLPPDALPGNLAEEECILGLEFAGRDSKGRRVMGMVPAQGLATMVVVDRTLLWEVPEKWSLEEASTIPVIYSTVYYALIIRGRLKPGDSILIHAGADGFGQAAISVALHMGCSVFTTVGSVEERVYLKQTFPTLADSNFANSRNSNFEQHLMTATKGRGVDLVLNSLPGELLLASVRCLAKNGRFCEIGKLNFSNNTPLGLSLFSNNVSFHGILLDSLFDDSGESCDVVKLVSDGFKNGAVRPLPVTLFDDTEVEQAFRLATGEHIGKVVLKIRDEESRASRLATPKYVSAIPRTYFKAEKSYLLVGGLGGFGLELTNWLIGRGATKVVLTSRRGVYSGYQSLCVRKWKSRGISVLISTIDCSSVAGATKNIEKTLRLGPVGGIFNLAAVIDDALMQNQTPATFEKIAAPKINGTKNLDNVSRKLCPQLDHFVVFSSCTSGRGNPGQTNYGYANSAMERICEARHEAGLPGLAIQWGPIGDVGLLFDSLGREKFTVIAGLSPQRMSSCLAVLDYFLQQSHPVVASSIPTVKNEAASRNNRLPLINAIANAIGILDLKAVNTNASLAEMGLDSLMEFEVKNILEYKYSVVMRAQEIRKLTFAKLLELQNDSSSQSVLSQTKECNSIPRLPN